PVFGASLSQADLAGQDTTPDLRPEFHVGEHSCLPLSGSGATLSLAGWRLGALHFWIGTALHFSIGIHRRAAREPDRPHGLWWNGILLLAPGRRRRPWRFRAALQGEDPLRQILSEFGMVLTQLLGRDIPALFVRLLPAGEEVREVVVPAHDDSSAEE